MLCLWNTQHTPSASLFHPRRVKHSSKLEFSPELHLVHSRAGATTLQRLRNTRVEYVKKPQETRSAAPQQHLLTLLQPSSTRAWPAHNSQPWDPKAAPIAPNTAQHWIYHIELAGDGTWNQETQWQRPGYTHGCVWRSALVQASS